MPKATSSASKATRKKHAAKQVAKTSNPEDVQTAPPVTKKKDKKSTKGEPKKKVFVPPPKPPRGVIDPVDLYGIATSGLVGAQVIVILRLLGKRDDKTVARAIDELTTWVTDALKSTDVGEVLALLPVWVRGFSTAWDPEAPSFLIDL